MTTNPEGFNYTKRKTKKSQIVLCNTLRPYQAYIGSLKYRNNRTNDKTPHFVISKRGEILSVFPTEYYSNMVAHKNAVVIAVENLGWLQKCTISPVYLNWIGDVFRGAPYVDRWRDRFFWDPYTEQQMEALASVIHGVCEKHEIPKDLHHPGNCWVKNPAKLSGVLSRSVFADIYTDMSPSFDWGELEKQLQYESEKASQSK